MRLQSKTQISVRDTVIGGPNPLVCIPVVAADTKALLEQVEILKPLSPDIVEWRVDSYQGIGDIATCLTATDTMRKAIGDIPLIFTCRIEAEGGMQPLSQEARLAIIKAAIGSGKIDIVDIELMNGEDFIEAVRTAAQANGVKLILSYHDFKKTPAEDLILSKLEQAQTLGADIAKVATMPTCMADVLTLLQATLKARTEVLTVPIVTMAMAKEGVITRMAGGLFGADITFAIGQASSAPGQIPIGDLRQAMSLLY